MTASMISFGLFFFALGIAPFLSQADAVCCFPYNMNYYSDPVTGELVLNGELQNDSYRREPFGNIKYRFIFSDDNNAPLLERSASLTDKLPVSGGAVIQPPVVFPFQVTLGSVDEKTLAEVRSFRMDGTESLDYFPWKPVDLVVSSGSPVNIGKVAGKHGDVFNRWQISGNVTNTHSQATQNVYVVASMRNENGSVVGVAGYSDSVQPVKLGGFETKGFAITALVPASEVPSEVVLYAESDDSSMMHPKYKPVIMRGMPNPEGRVTTDPKKPITISANITNVSRDDIGFEWIIQIKKSQKGASEGDLTEYPDNKVALIDVIPGSIGAQKSAILEYQWVPQSNGVYFYEMYLWDASRAKALSFPFMRSFLDDNWMIVSSNLNSVTNQVKSGVPLDEIQCKDGLERAHRAENGNVVCIKPETRQKLVERGWANASDVDVLSNQHADISAIKYRYHQIVNEPITDFYVKIEGTGYNYHPPNLWIDNPDDKTVWTNDHIKYLGSGRSIPGDFCKEYTFYSIGGPVILNATGLYTLHMSFEGHTTSYDLSVKENQTEYNYPTYGEHCETTLSEQVNGYDNFIFTVSNQSMDKDPVNILVQIDDDVVIDSSFEAGNQHNFHDYGFLLTEGNHTIAAKSRGENAWLIQDFAISGKQWGYLSYWHEEESENPHFEIIVDDKEINFE